MSALAGIIAAETRRETFPAAKAFAAHLTALFGEATAGVVFYGSCLRQNTDEGLMLDFYVLVDNYSAALRNKVSAAFARLLPPNVYYFEIPFEGRRLRAKVAVMAVGQFLRAAGPETFASSVWARFAQPALILQTRNDEIRRRIEGALASAVETMIARARPLMGARFTARGLWVRAFASTYGAELRPEKESKAAEIVDGDLARYQAVTAAVLGAEPYPAASKEEQRTAQNAWKWRRIQGKTLNALRLIKAAFTFQGGLDYAVWKIERHSGVKITLTAADRKRPLVTGVRLFLQTVRKGGLR